jgi:superfamily II DNA or RNA helicase
MDSFSDRSTIIFVQTNEIAERLQRFIIRQPGWSPEASIYIYDSTKDKDYLSYALNQFRKNLGFCLISEKMLSEGFDLPKVDQIILYGSDRSPRDWIQKVGRAMRFDKRDPNSIADIIDIVFCDNNGETLSMEIERYECLTAIGQTG